MSDSSLTNKNFLIYLIGNTISLARPLGLPPGAWLAGLAAHRVRILGRHGRIYPVFPHRSFRPVIWRARRPIRSQSSSDVYSLDQCNKYVAAHYANRVRQGRYLHFVCLVLNAGRF